MFIRYGGNNMNDEYEKINRELYNIAYNKSYFMVNWYEGAVLPKNHPNYFNGRIDIKIAKQFNNYHGNINFEKDEYPLTKEVVNELYDYIEKNINKLINISLKQNDEAYDGVADSLDIKYKSIYLTISGLNATTEEDFNEINNIKSDIKNILISNK